ncbi:galactose-specific lectin nattectin-like [Halichoeres trimaculatus]|uniref:galactose-specific lectin nattectin-like n=1 Tax=Halichoeres trimaculatus TaxID=147232 RepID=UPI003D9EA537
MEIEERCYLFQATAKDWCDAEKSCINKGGNLASFHDEKELAAIKKVVSDVGNNVTIWLGGYDSVHEGSWKWADGSKFDYTGWHVESPNNPDKEDCMQLKKGGVIDAVCKHMRAFVCSTDPKAS